jgi:hypothetical protein
MTVSSRAAALGCGGLPAVARLERSTAGARICWSVSTGRNRHHPRRRDEGRRRSYVRATGDLDAIDTRGDPELADELGKVALLLTTAIVEMPTT